MNSKNGMNKRKHIWQKAFSLSFAFHLLVILTVGAMAASFHQEIQRPQEQLITVNLADTPEEIAKAQENASPFSKLKNMLESSSPQNDSPTKDSSTGNNNSSTESNSANSTANSNSETAAPGEISSPDGILPPSQGGGGNSDSSNSESTGGGGSESGGSSSGGGGSESSGGGSSTGNGSGSGGTDTESAQNVANRFSAAVNGNKQYPRAAVRLNQQGTVGLNVVLDANGNLVSASVISSVNGNLDKAAINAVYASCPFPHRHGSSVDMNINVNFYLQ